MVARRLARPASWETRPRHWWLLAIPALMLIQSLVQLGTAPWGDQQLGAIVVVAVGLALVGIGEELYFRGILRVSVRAHHGEFLTLLVTASLFGLAHSFGSLMQRIPLETIAFQVSVTAFTGVSLYAAFRATGRLWVPMALHALDDFSIFLHSGEPGSVQAPGTPGDRHGAAAPRRPRRRPRRQHDP
ncbi:CPBP family intramembrane glutamic endopeptidase [Agromyces italicus]|uniref:CPBP family intramembrane glutamic endopeptidase n=1 Tax=Agromyces italicus TaxID=279572 RepID=UPI0003B5B646|nr:CPBP family intramembrane glutamic endopeptidase [Agromyces italicus]